MAVDRDGFCKVRWTAILTAANGGVWNLSGIAILKNEILEADSCILGQKGTQSAIMNMTRSGPARRYYN